jgi:hypothetical protein
MYVEVCIIEVLIFRERNLSQKLLSLLIMMSHCRHLHLIMEDWRRWSFGLALKNKWAGRNVFYFSEGLIPCLLKQFMCSPFQNANRGVDDILQSGAGILENLRDQRMTIKGAHRRLYDIANTLGLSNTTMRFIERRAYQDQFILFGGMVVTLIVIGLIVVYCT